MSHGENGYPEVNAGRGSIVKIAVTDTFQTGGVGSPGNGGIAQGLDYNASAQTGGFSYGGSSFN